MYIGFLELNEIKGIGLKRVQALNDVGIFSPTDLLLRFPDKYIFSDVLLNGNERDGDEISFVGTVTKEAARQFIRRGLTVVTCYFVNNGITVKCSWFNQPFAARSLKIGDKIYVTGKVKRFGKALQITNPTLLQPKAGDGGIIPLYKTAIPSRTFEDAVKTALDNVRINSYVPQDIARKFGIMPLTEALNGVHLPRSREQLIKARRSVSIENLCYVITTYRLVKDDKRDFVYNAAAETVEKYIRSLPFELTVDQRNAVDGIISGMISDKLVNMLVQGEVGCGKTVVALCAMYFAAMSGFQAAIMAPTEILARQHYVTMSRILEPLGVKSQLLCASMNKVQKETALFNIRYGTVSCIVGTQSLISDDIDYNDLRLVIVDEQQRFGVNQRAKLERKGKKTDIIVMTATPIPRTLALSLYGELKVSEIHALPAGRPKIHTSIVPEKKIKDMYGYIGECAKRDERTYIICPRIADTDNDVTGVEQIYSMLKKSPLAPITGCINGKMKEPDKTAVMSDFKSGKIKVLVSTTVIEVGIDVPEATNVIVYDAERFGLAQLHQIRGRVGRGSKESYCFLLGGQSSPEALDRLKRFCEVTDGFSVSELDFKLRGAGDFVGLRQHGNGTLEIDESIIERARLLSEAVIADGRSSDAIIRSMNNPEFIRSVTMN